MRRVFALYLILCAIAGMCAAREIHVHAGSQADGADGSALRPFRTITEALNVVKGGDTVIVREGIYRESVRVPGGEPGNPVSLTAAPAERVILSGAVPVTGWKEHRSGVYTTVLDFRPERLLAAYRAQPIAREPNEGWWVAEAADDLTITDVAHLKTLSPELAADEAYIWVTAGNTFFTVPVVSLDRENGRLTVARETQWMRLSAGDRYYLQNHPSLIDSPGEWAVQKEGDQFRIYFQPAALEDLRCVEAPREPGSVLSIRGASNVCISGLEVAASARNGIEVMRAENVVISSCISHNHGFIGIFLRDVKDVTVRRSMAVRNSYGVALHTATDIVVEDNEIAYNTTDGLVISWNSTDVAVRRNYVHHQLLWGHPDNIQIYIGVKNVSFIDNLLIGAGQSIMMGDTSDGLLKGNMIIGSAAFSVIFGHRNSQNYRIHNNTIAFSGIGCMNLTARDYDVRENIFVSGSANLLFTVRGVEGYTGDRNLLYNAPGLARKTVVVSDRGWHQTLEDYQRATGYDLNSAYGDPGFRHAPSAFAVLDYRRIADCSRDVFYVADGSDLFDVGDTVEVDFDGVPRTVTNRDRATITVSPGLRAKPLKLCLICNWGRSRDSSLDLRLDADSPGAKLSASGGPVGSTIDIAAYQRGDFDADGKRDLPDPPPELRPENTGAQGAP